MEDKIIVTPKETGEVQVEAQTPTVDATQPVANYQPLVGFLDIDQPTIEQKNQLKAIWEFFNPDGKKSNTEVLYAIRSTENRFQGLRLNETRLNRLYQYVKIRKDIENNEKLLNEL